MRKIKEIKHQFQPTEVSCGQTCAAMLMGKPVYRVEHIFGDLNNPMSGVTLCERLTRHGIKMSDRIFNVAAKQIKNGGIKGTAILRLWNVGMMGHAAILKGKTVYDPTYGIYPLKELRKRTKSEKNPGGFFIESYWRVIE